MRQDHEDNEQQHLEASNRGGQAYADGLRRRCRRTVHGNRLPLVPVCKYWSWRACTVPVGTESLLSSFLSSLITCFLYLYDLLIPLQCISLLHRCQEEQLLTSFRFMERWRRTVSHLDRARNSRDSIFDINHYPSSMDGTAVPVR